MDLAALQDAYRQMSFIRAFELRLNALFLDGVVSGTTHLCIGQEACAVGLCRALAAEDVLFSNHRGHGHLLARGASPSRLMAEIFGSRTGYAGGRGGSQHVAVKELNFLGTHGITAGSIPLAVGAALHLKQHRQPGIAVVFFGDGAVGEGVFHESLNMASIWGLRVLFVCENNQYAMSSAHRRFSPVPHVVDRAGAYGMAAEAVDGNDVEAVNTAAAHWRQRLEADQIPALLELRTYRQCGHSRSDRCLYRSREEEEEWRHRDPILLTRTALAERCQWTDEDDARLQEDVQKHVAEAERRAMAQENSGDA